MAFSEKQNLPEWLTSERTYQLVQQLEEQLKNRQIDVQLSFQAR
jgi:hypothetical protein